MIDLLIFSTIIILLLNIYYNDDIFSKSVKDTRTEEQKEYDNFMDKSGDYDDDEEDIIRYRQWREKVYGKKI